MSREDQLLMSESQARQDVKMALVKYRDLLRECCDLAENGKEYTHYLTSLTQVESALRVLWMEVS